MRVRVRVRVREGVGVGVDVDVDVDVDGGVDVDVDGGVDVGVDVVLCVSLASLKYQRRCYHFVCTALVNMHTCARTHATCTHIHSCTQIYSSAHTHIHTHTCTCTHAHTQEQDAWMAAAQGRELVAGIALPRRQQVSYTACVKRTAYMKRVFCAKCDV